LSDDADCCTTVPENFEKNTDFAITLWTADDIGTMKGTKDYENRATQNVVFETGFYWGVGKGKEVVLR